ncbi:MAG: hypothetical protein JSR61_02975 [Proteobacteria bacterium]|nr:hypothetical protein [Pseudomonadota bacterium]
MRSGGGPAGSSRQERLDPFALPVSFATSDGTAGVRVIEIHPERVVVRRSLSGMVMALNMPVSAYEGVALKLVRGRHGAPGSAEITLEHKDPGLTVSLYASAGGDEFMTEWQGWSDALGLPMIVNDIEDGWRRIGELRAAKVRPRRRRHSTLKRRRPVFLARRKAGSPVLAMAVYRGEDEIIARN